MTSRRITRAFASEMSQLPIECYEDRQADKENATSSQPKSQSKSGTQSRASKPAQGLAAKSSNIEQQYSDSIVISDDDNDKEPVHTIKKNTALRGPPHYYRHQINKGRPGFMGRNTTTPKSKKRVPSIIVEKEVVFEHDSEENLKKQLAEALQEIQKHKIAYSRFEKAAYAETTRLVKENRELKMNLDSDTAEVYDEEERKELEAALRKVYTQIDEYEAAQEFDDEDKFVKDKEILREMKWLQ